MNQQELNQFVKAAENLTKSIMKDFDKAIENMTPEQAMEYQKHIQKLKQNGFDVSLTEAGKIINQFRDVNKG